MSANRNAYDVNNEFRARLVNVMVEFAEETQVDKPSPPELYQRAKERIDDILSEYQRPPMLN